MYIIVEIRIAKSESNSVPITNRSQSHSQLQLHFKVMYPVHNSEGLEPPGSISPCRHGLITSDRGRHLCHHHRVLPDSWPSQYTQHFVGTRTTTAPDSCRHGLRRQRARTPPSTRHRILPDSWPQASKRFCITFQFNFQFNSVVYNIGDN